MVKKYRAICIVLALLYGKISFAGDLTLKCSRGDSRGIDLDLTNIPFMKNNELINLGEAIGLNFIDVETIVNLVVKEVKDFCFNRDTLPGNCNPKLAIEQMDKLKPLGPLGSPALIENDQLEYEYKLSGSFHLHVNFMNPLSQNKFDTFMNVNSRYWTVGGGIIGDSLSHYLWFGIKGDKAKLGYTGTMDLQNNALLYGGYLQGWDDMAGFAVMAGGYGENGLGGVGQFYFKKSKNRLVKYTGDHFDEIEKESILPTVEIADHESREYRGYAGFFTGPVMSLGLGAMVGLKKEGVTKYNVVMSPRNIQKYLKDADTPGFKRVFKKNMVEDLPDIRDPEEWKVGESIKTQLSGIYYGTFSLGLDVILGVQALRGGIITTLKGTFSLLVKKISQDKILVEILPHKIKDFGPYIHSMGLLVVTKLTSHSSWPKQILEFDLTNPKSKEVYQELLRGKMPVSPIYKNNKIKTNIIEDFEGDRIFLAEHGIERKFLEKGIAQSQQYWGGIKIEWLPKGKKWGGVGKGLRVGSEIVSQTNGKEQVVHELSYSKKKHEFFNRGESTKGGLVHVTKVVNGQNIEEIKSIVLRATLSKSAITGMKHQSMSNFLAKYFDLKFSAFEYKGQRESKKIDIKRIINYSDLLYLKQNNLAISSDVLSKYNLSKKEINQLDESFKSGDVEAMVAEIENLVKNKGIKGVAFIHKLLGSDARNISILVRSDVFSSLEQKIKNIYAKFYNLDPGENEKKIIDPQESRFQVRRYIKEISFLSDELKMAIEYVNRHPLLLSSEEIKNYPENFRTSKEEILKGLLKGQSKIEKLLDFKAQGLSPEEINLLKFKALRNTILGRKSIKRSFE